MIQPGLKLVNILLYVSRDDNLVMFCCNYKVECLWITSLLSLLVKYYSCFAIMAGDENGVPIDSPFLRIDMLGANSLFNCVGGLEITSNDRLFYASATAISKNWLLTAAHNFDLDENGVVDEQITVKFNLPEIGVFGIDSFYLYPEFTGFSGESIKRDLALVYLSEPLPDIVLYPTLALHPVVGDKITLVGFGKSGFGNYGYTVQANIDIRRIGFNTIDYFEYDNKTGLPVLCYYDFDCPETVGCLGGSLGNDLESIIAPGDSGGPILISGSNEIKLVGVSTFCKGYGGRFGDIGGGVIIEPYLEWIFETTAIEIPEVSSFFLMQSGVLILLRFIAGKQK